MLRSLHSAWSVLPLVDSREKFLAAIEEGKKSAAEGHVHSIDEN